MRSLRANTALLVLVAASAAAIGCASTGGVPHPFPVPSARAPQAPEAPATKDRATPDPATSDPTTDAARPAQPVIETALALRGVPYRNGGADPTGFDCSGFTQYVFAQHGIMLPRAVHDQYEDGLPVKTPDLAPGDLVFFTTTGRGATHVGVVVNSDWFVHAPSSTGVVRVERLSASYWSSRFVGARRYAAPPVVGRLPHS